VFGVSPASASLVITAFTLPGIVFSPLAGLLADRYGRKVVVVPSLLLVAAGGIACAFAPNFTLLVVCRFIQGIGTAPLGLLNSTIIADAHQDSSLTRMMGYNATVLSLGTALFPTLGGALAHLDWRLTFFLPAFALPVLLLALKTPLAGPGRDSGVTQYVRESWAVGTQPRYLVLFGITLLTFTMLYGPIITCFPQLAHASFGASPGTIGLTMVASSFGAGLVASQLERLSRVFSSRKLLIVSQLFYLAALTTLPLMHSHWMTAVSVMLFGFGQGLNVPNVATMLVTETPPSQRAVIMAVNGMLLRLGQTLGPALFSALMVWGGTSVAFYAGSLLSLGMLFMAARLLQERNRDTRAPSLWKE
jgi:MFS family permease